jgi:hypothetical protein
MCQGSYDLQLNHHRLKPVGLKEPTYSKLESAKAASPSWGNMEITVILLEVLGGYVFHDNFVSHVTG